MGHKICVSQMWRIKVKTLKYINLRMSLILFIGTIIVEIGSPQRRLLSQFSTHI